MRRYNKIRKAGFETLRIWKEAHELMLEVHRIANQLPYSEKERKSQMKRSSSSVPDNIAECYGAFYFKAKIKCLVVARKEANETQNHLIAVRDQKILENSVADELISRYQGLIIGINAYKKKIIASQKDYKSKNSK